MRVGFPRLEDLALDDFTLVLHGALGVVVTLGEVVHALLDFGVLFRDLRGDGVHFGLLGLFLGDEADSHVDFLGSRLALEHDAVEREDAAQIVVGPCEFAAGDDAAGDVHGHRAVHQEERLLRDDGGRTFGVRHVGVAEVEDIQDLRHIAPVNVAVDAAAVAVGLVGDVDGLASYLRIEAARHGEQRIAERLEVEAADICAPEEPVVRIDVGVIGAGDDVSALLIDAGEHDELVQFLDAPVRALLVHKPAREVVYQLGMRGLFAHHAEVVGRADEAFAEVLQPHAVHEDASGERVVLGGDCLCEFEAAAAAGELRAFAVLTEEGHEAARHLAAGGASLAAKEELRISR